MITIVTGLRRLGTSMAMQMLHAGGLPCVHDAERIRPDEDNPRGYFEMGKQDDGKQDGDQLQGVLLAEGKAIKRLLPSEIRCTHKLPAGPDYRIIFMRRPMPEVVASWKRFYHRRKGINQDGKPLLYFEEPIRRSAKEIAKEFGVKPAQVLRVKYHDVIRDPKLAAAAMVEFLGVPLDVDAMAGAVDPSLYRNRLCQEEVEAAS